MLVNPELAKDGFSKTPDPVLDHSPEPSAASVDTEIVVSPQVTLSITLVDDVITGAAVKVPDNDMVGELAAVAEHVISPVGDPEALFDILTYIVVNETDPLEGNRFMLLEKLLLSCEISKFVGASIVIPSLFLI